MTFPGNVFPGNVFSGKRLSAKVTFRETTVNQTDIVITILRDRATLTAVWPIMDDSESDDDTTI